MYWQLGNQIAQFLESIITITAIIIGGLWTYLLFIHNRQKFPRANIRQEISNFTLNENYNILHLNLVIENLGNVLIEIREIEVRVKQVLPIQESMKPLISEKMNIENIPEIDWPELTKKKNDLEKNLYEVEPGETDSLSYDFVIDKYLELVEIYSHVINIKKKKEIGWTCTDYHEIPKMPQDKIKEHK